MKGGLAARLDQRLKLSNESRNGDAPARCAALHDHSAAGRGRARRSDSLDGGRAALGAQGDRAHFVFGDAHQLRGDFDLAGLVFRKALSGLKSLLDGRRIVAHAAAAIFRFPCSGHVDHSLEVWRLSHASMRPLLRERAIISNNLPRISRRCTTKA
jgi:hypothetical protein